MGSTGSAWPVPLRVHPPAPLLIGTILRRAGGVKIEMQEPYRGRGMKIDPKNITVR